MRSGYLKYFIMTHQHTEAKIISPKKRESLTEPHYMFCGILGFRGTPVEEHWIRIKLKWCACFIRCVPTQSGLRRVIRLRLPDHLKFFQGHFVFQ